VKTAAIELGSRCPRVSISRLGELSQRPNVQCCTQLVHAVHGMHAMCSVDRLSGTNVHVRARSFHSRCTRCNLCIANGTDVHVSFCQVRGILTDGVRAESGGAFEPVVHLQPLLKLLRLG
jgi:hypothetical protein